MTAAGPFGSADQPAAGRGPTGHETRVGDGAPSDDDRIWQGVGRHLAQVERLVPEAPAWRPSAVTPVEPTAGKRRLAGLGALGAVGAVAAAVILVATLTLGPLGSRVGTPSPAPAAAWSRLHLESVSTGSLFGPYGSVTSMLAWQGGFVAAGTVAANDPATFADISAAVWWSVDGRAWARAALPDAHGASIKQLLVWGDRLLAVGEPEFVPSCPVPCWPSPPQWLWSSSDGRTWQRIDTGATFANGPTSFNMPVITSMAAGTNGLVAVGGTGIDSPSIWTSADGTAWRSADLTRAMPHGELDDVTTFGGHFIAIGSVAERPVSEPLGLIGAARRTVILTSADGQDWTATDVEPQPASPLSGLFATATGLIATEPGCPANASCATSTPLYASSDGRSWRPLPGEGPQPGDATASDAQRIVAIRADPGSVQAWTTSGGSDWQAVPVEGAFAGPLLPQPTISAMAVGRAGVVIAGYVATRTGATPHLWLATPVGATARPPVSPQSASTSTPNSSSSAGPSPSPSSTPTPSPSTATSWGSLDWREATFPDHADATVTAIVGWHRGFVAGGSVKTSGSIEAALWSSADGSTWQRVGQGTPDLAGARILQILATPTALLALGQTPEPAPACPAPGKDAPYDPYHCLSAMPAILWRSSDGRTWTRVDSGSSLAEATISAIAVSGGRFVAVGYAGDQATQGLATATWTSADGTAWQRGQDLTAFGHTRLDGVIAMATGFVAYGETWPADASFGDPHLAAGIWSSADGLVWQRAMVPPVGWGIASAYAGADGALAVSEPCSPLDPCSPNLWSKDGQTWSSLPDGTIDEPLGAQAGVGAAFGTDGSRIVAAGGAQAGLVQVSTDGRHWGDISGSGGPPTTAGTWLVGVDPSSLIVVTMPGDGSPLGVWLAEARP